MSSKRSGFLGEKGKSWKRIGFWVLPTPEASQRLACSRACAEGDRDTAGEGSKFSTPKGVPEFELSNELLLRHISRIRQRLQPRLDGFPLSLKEGGNG